MTNLSRNRRSIEEFAYYTQQGNDGVPQGEKYVENMRTSYGMTPELEAFINAPITPPDIHEEFVLNPVSPPVYVERHSDKACSFLLFPRQNQSREDCFQGRISDVKLQPPNLETR
ncbi:hypothetical protein L1887_34288 [Cichorium endivia]|nr:hypothetical protein L1887_34288 [Cichorium endivia]